MFSLIQRRHLVVGLSLIVAVGCNSGPTRLAVSKVDADKAANLVMERYDRDGDGILNSEELKDCPSLAFALDAYDTDNDGTLSRDEIVAGINRWAASRKAAFSLPFQVQLDGRPVNGAVVKLVPEDFLSGAIKPASGVADEGGSGFLDLAPEDRPANAPRMPMVPPGLYRVEITHPTISIPARYNANTTLGVETSIASQRPGGVTWNLSSRN